MSTLGLACVHDVVLKPIHNSSGCGGAVSGSGPPAIADGAVEPVDDEEMIEMEAAALAQLAGVGEDTDDENVFPMFSGMSRRWSALQLRKHAMHCRSLAL